MADVGMVKSKKGKMISYTSKGKPLALPWGRTLRLDSGIRASGILGFSNILLVSLVARVGPLSGKDSMVITNEDFHYIRHNNKGNQRLMTLKLDLNKAFDRVEWDFLAATLKKIKFADRWCQWILACLISYELEFLIHGDSIGNIKPTRGIQQGDPLSPYLFIIIADVVSRMVSKAVDNSLVSGIKMARTCPIISHIFFAGQNINFTKSSSLFPLNCLEDLQQQLCDLLNVQHMDPKACYLGLPSIIGRNKNELFSFILEKVLHNMQGWKQKLLSQAGCEILIKSVIQDIPLYAMYCYLLLKGFLDKLLTHIHRFFWHGDAHGKHIHWLKWDRLLKPKDEEGLGFRDLHQFNLALLAKQASIGSHPSWLWKSLLHGREVLLQGIRWQGPFRNNSRVFDFIVDGEWDYCKLQHHLLPTEEDFVSQIPISNTGAQDKLVWHYDAKEFIMFA
ncbi:reverse transcriptase [Tanacetum coccineum]|uniref:Reverse transcriptase n=1 Tax=Tanacetum coccineum TaxID=301880 RepID=A0ABQ5CH75_9ASTR